jgi:hypothetical protein
MEFKGTKGKWIFNQEEMKIKGSGDVEGLTIIANVSPKMDFSRGKTTQSYNALLISKAPEMLEMLKQCVETLEFGGQIGFTYMEAKQLIKEATEI